MDKIIRNDKLRFSFYMPYILKKYTKEDIINKFIELDIGVIKNVEFVLLNNNITLPKVNINDYQSAFIYFTSFTLSVRVDQMHHKILVENKPYKVYLDRGADATSDNYWIYQKNYLL